MVAEFLLFVYYIIPSFGFIDANDEAINSANIIRQ